MGNKSRIDAGFSGKGRNPVKTGMPTGDGGKDRKPFEWVVVARCLSGLSTLVQSGNYREKDLHPSFCLICCLLMLSHQLACVTSCTNIGLTVTERLDSFNFTISCDVSEAETQLSPQSIFMRFSFIKILIFFHQRGRSFRCRICHLESSQLENLSFAKSKAL